MAAEQNGNKVELQQREPQPIVSIRATIPVADLGPAMGARLSALSGYLKRSGAQPAGPPFVRYHTFEEIETDLETGIPVVEPVAGEGRIAGGELPGGAAISTWHSGPHDKLGDAYARIEAWLQEHGRERDGAAWEVYHWIDPGQELDPSSWDPSTWHTQLVQPVK
jgi:effector-binding domain-containing protein